MRLPKIALIITMLYICIGCTTTLKMSAPPKLDISGFKQFPFVIGLYIPDEVKNSSYIEIISPFDKMSIPIGEQTHQLFKDNLSNIFKKVIDVDSINSETNVDMILEVSIVKFDAVIPKPAYNPYMATIIYRVDIFDRNREKIFTQSATGEAQLTKGIFSGFKARSICAEVIHKAMEDSLRKIIEGFYEAEEIKNYK
ncbi:MAG: hypothetical protein ACFFDN_03525 [Candidatus Hodarchaeota archaeon]